MCHYFFRPEYRNDWETTLEKMTVAETISEDTILFWQIHKSIWPVTQRDAVFWSHMTQVPDPSDRDAQNIWIVVNNSTDLDAYPPNQGKYLRLFLTVCMLCQTLVTPPKQGTTITRQDIACKITYCSV
ncbi:collagen type IV alpha-3-binding protein-like, partial [Diaphorina citri]|uniref:Collagen type IV alpha-3-binding protein-like n=1 Tax=Diaphorina citri TaxID=121845 RepID=A0A1S3DR54_DIACI